MFQSDFRFSRNRGQGAGTLGKNKTVNAFVRGVRGAATHQVAHVGFGDFVVGEIQRGQALFAQHAHERGGFASLCDGEAHEDVRDGRYWGCSRRMRRGAIEWTFIGWNEMRA
jgi:hypothetical protein